MHVILSEAKNLREDGVFLERFFASLRMAKMLPDHFTKPYQSENSR